METHSRFTKIRSRRLLKSLGLVLIMALVLVGAAYAAGNSPAQRSAAGWTCVNAGPNNWVHCFPPGAFISDPSLTVQVFNTEDLTSTDGNTYLGTEILIRADLYAGQPCMQDGGEPYDWALGNAYRACHHFDTSN